MNCIERSTLAYLRSVNTPNYPLVDYLPVAPGSPEETLITTVPRKYLTLTGDVLAEVDQATKDSIDVALIEASRDDSVTAQLDQTEEVLRAFMLAVIDEFNIVRNHAYGGLYVSTPQTAQSVPNNVWTALDALTGATAMALGGGVTATGGVVTLPSAGDWVVDWSVSFSGSNATEYAFAAYGNNTRVDASLAKRVLGATGGSDVGSVSGRAIINAPVAGVDISLRVQHSEGSAKDVTIEALQLSVVEVTDRPDRTTAQLRTAIRNRLGS